MKSDVGGKERSLLSRAKRKGAPVTFDQDVFTKYVTTTHQRKLQRQAFGRKKWAERAREEKLAESRERQKEVDVIIKKHFGDIKVNDDGSITSSKVEEVSQRAGRRDKARLNRQNNSNSDNSDIDYDYEHHSDNDDEDDQTKDNNKNLITDNDIIKPVSHVETIVSFNDANQDAIDSYIRQKARQNKFLAMQQAKKAKLEEDQRNAAAPIVFEDDDTMVTVEVSDLSGSQHHLVSALAQQQELLSNPINNNSQGKKGKNNKHSVDETSNNAKKQGNKLTQFLIDDDNNNINTNKSSNKQDNIKKTNKTTDIYDEADILGAFADMINTDNNTNDDDDDNDWEVVDEAIIGSDHDDDDEISPDNIKKQTKKEAQKKQEKPSQNDKNTKNDKNGKNNNNKKQTKSMIDNSQDLSIAKSVMSDLLGDVLDHTGSTILPMALASSLFTLPQPQCWSDEKSRKITLANKLTGADAARQRKPTTLQSLENDPTYGWDEGDGDSNKDFGEIMGIPAASMGGRYRKKPLSEKNKAKSSRARKERKSLKRRAGEEAEIAQSFQDGFNTDNGFMAQSRNLDLSFMDSDDDDDNRGGRKGSGRKSGFDTPGDESWEDRKGGKNKGGNKRKRNDNNDDDSFGGKTKKKKVNMRDVRKRERAHKAGKMVSGSYYYGEKGGAVNI